MPRYFFNVFGNVDLHDAEGTELSNLCEVRLYMLSVAMEVIETDKDQNDTWQMEAIDERGIIVGTLDFGLSKDEEGWER